VRAALEAVHRMILLERGRIVLEGPAEDMRGNPRIAEAYLGAQRG
jgi:branched-chain amino acid transport system ATP-binding protein